MRAIVCKLKQSIDEYLCMLILTRILEGFCKAERSMMWQSTYYVNCYAGEYKSSIISSIIAKLSARKGKVERDRNATKFYLVWSH